MSITNWAIWTSEAYVSSLDVHISYFRHLNCERQELSTVYDYLFVFNQVTYDYRNGSKHLLSSVYEILNGTSKI